METVFVRKRYLEERLAVASSDRQAAQGRIVAFQEAYQIIGIPKGSHETVDLVHGFTQELLTKEVELQSLRKLLPTNDPAVVQLQRETRIMQRALEEMQTGFRYFSAHTIPQERLPVIVADYLNLWREVIIQEDNYLRLRGQYELTRIEETDPARTFQIIEEVEIPETKSRPSRVQVGLVGTMIVFLLSALLSFFLEYIAHVRADPTKAAKLAAIRGEMNWKFLDRSR